MYAIIRTGNRQYRVQPGQLLRVEKLERNLGEQFDLDEVLFIGGERSLVGTPTVKGAKVSVVVTQQTKAPKVLVFKKKIRHNYRRLKGHRQLITELFVVAISADGKTTKAETKPIIVDPAKKMERVEKQKALPKAQRKAAKKKKVAKKASGVQKKSVKKKKKIAKKKVTKKK